MRHIRASLGIGLVVWSVLALADPTEDLVQLDLGLIQQRADAGDADAQLELGDRHSRGREFQASSLDAVIWWRKSAAQGNLQAMFRMGQFESNSDANATAAVDWYQRAANLGYVQAEVSLGQAYEHGSGICQDQAKALFWYRRASEQGNSWAKTAAAGLEAQNTSNVPARPGSCVLDSLTLNQRATRGDASARAQIDRNTTKSLDQLRDKAAHGDTDAQAELGSTLVRGSYTIPPDPAQAVTWWRTCAAHGNVGCESYLGWAYESGTGVAQNFSTALLWYRKAGDEQAADLLTRQHPELLAPPVTAGLALDSQNGGGESQEIAEKIESLQADIEQHETAAQRWSDNAQNLASGNCSGIGAALCQGIGQAGVAQALANRNNELNQANADRAKIRQLQGQAARSAPQLDASFSGNFQQVTSSAGTGDAGTSRQQQPIQVHLASQRAPLQATSQGTNIVVRPATTYQGSATVVTPSTGAQSSNSNSSTASRAIQYSTPLATSCVRQFWDPNTYNWLSFENNCGQAIYLNYIPHRPGGWAMGGGMHLAPGSHNNTGLSSAEINQTGGFDLYVCPTDSVPVDLSGNAFNVNVPQYRCKPQ